MIKQIEMRIDTVDLLAIFYCPFHHFNVLRFFSVSFAPSVFLLPHHVLILFQYQMY